MDYKLSAELRGHEDDVSQCSFLYLDKPSKGELQSLTNAGSRRHLSRPFYRSICL